MNGEIYNHEELRKQLPNHKFRTQCDCDVIAHLVSRCHSHLCCAIAVYAVAQLLLEFLFVIEFGNFVVSTRNMEKILWICWTAYFRLLCWILATTVS